MASQMVSWYQIWIHNHPNHHHHGSLNIRLCRTQIIVGADNQQTNSNHASTY
jgi:hypothetical protein